MSAYYFAYGSNMNPARMKARGMMVADMQPGTLQGMRLAFNKRAADAPNFSCANVVYDTRSLVEGVLYRLAGIEEIGKMDYYEGTPRFYSRDIFTIETAAGAVPAWVYIANAAVISEGLKPSQQYLQHLLAGREFLSSEYYGVLLDTPC